MYHHQTATLPPVQSCRSHPNIFLFFLIYRNKNLPSNSPGHAKTNQARLTALSTVYGIANRGSHSEVSPGRQGSYCCGSWEGSACNSASNSILYLMKRQHFLSVLIFCIFYPPSRSIPLLGFGGQFMFPWIYWHKYPVSVDHPWKLFLI